MSGQFKVLLFSVLFLFNSAWAQEPENIPAEPQKTEPVIEESALEEQAAIVEDLSVLRTLPWIFKEADIRNVLKINFFKSWGQYRYYSRGYR